MLCPSWPDFCLWSDHKVGHDSPVTSISREHSRFYQNHYFLCFSCDSYPTVRSTTPAWTSGTVSHLLGTSSCLCVRWRGAVAIWLHTQENQNGYVWESKKAGQRDEDAVRHYVHCNPAGQVCSLLQCGVPVLPCSGMRALCPPASSGPCYSCVWELNRVYHYPSCYSRKLVERQNARFRVSILTSSQGRRTLKLRHVRNRCPFHFVCNCGYVCV